MKISLDDNRNIPGIAFCLGGPFVLDGLKILQNLLRILFVFMIVTSLILLMLVLWSLD